MSAVEVTKVMTKRQISRKKWKDKNKEHTNAYNKKKYAENPEQFKSRMTKHKENFDWKSRDRNTTLVREYGITLNEYNTMLAKQGGVCAICNQPETAISRWNPSIIKNLSVDHNHITGKTRGLLCGQCNTAIGRFKDDINILQLAINYLRRFDDQS